MATALREFEKDLYSSFLVATPASPAIPITIPNGAIDVFRTNRGGNGQGFNPMTLLDTNLDVAGQMPKEVSFVARELGFGIFGGVTMSGARTIAERIACEFETPTWKLEFGPMLFHGLGGGVSGHSQIGGDFTHSIGAPLVTARTRFGKRGVLILRAGSTITGHFHVFRPIVIPAIQQIPLEPIIFVWRFRGRWVNQERLEKEAQARRRPAARTAA